MNINELVDEKKSVIKEVILPNTLTSTRVFIKRDDLLHPEISGNKWRKLKYNLVEAKKQNKNTLLTFGGAYSNHIFAVASAGNLFGFKTIGIIRGEEHLPLNPTLRFSVDHGMELHYLDRTTYRNRNDKQFQYEIAKQLGDVYIIPEGGTNKLAVKGCTEIVVSIDIDFDYICCACGSGGTLSGIVAGLKGEKQVLGFSALKGGKYLVNDVKKHIDNYCGEEFNNWDINDDYHFGGFAKVKIELIEFIKHFEELNKIELDFIYTGKMLYGIHDLISTGFFKEGSKIIAVHTGGLQGNIGMKNKVEKTLALHSSVS